MSEQEKYIEITRLLYFCKNSDGSSISIEDIIKKVINDTKEAIKIRSRITLDTNLKGLLSEDIISKILNDNDDTIEKAEVK